MSNNTLTLQSVVNLASTHAELMPLAGVGGYTLEPALSLCNDVVQELLAAPYAWKFNRVEMPMLVTAPSKQDYLFAGAAAFTLGSSSTGAAIDLATNNGITEASTTVTVKTLEPHGFSVGDTVYMTGNTVASYNSTFTQTVAGGSVWSGGWTITAVPSTTSFTFTHASSGLGTSGASGITDFGWLESASMTEMNTTSYPQNTRMIEAVGELQPTWKLSNPDRVCVLKDNGDGTLKIRFQYVPSTTIWGVNLIYQAKAPLKTALTDKWEPFPDHFSYVYRQGFLARCYRYLEKPRADVEYQKFQSAILKALGQSSSETDGRTLYPMLSLTEW